jgi:phage-related protein
MAQDEWIVEEYAKANGETPFGTFFASLTGKNRDDAIALLLALREHGNQLRPPRSKAIEQDLFELRGREVRSFYLFLPGRRIVLLDGIIKKSDKIPKHDLKRVRHYKREVKREA